MRDLPIPACCRCLPGGPAASSLPAGVRCWALGLSTMLAMLALAAGALGGEVELRPLEGAAARGTLAAVSTQEVALRLGDELRRWPVAQLHELILAPPEAAGQARLWLALREGSQLAAVGFTASQGQARVTLAGGYTVSLPTRAIRSVRFQTQTPELAEQWRQIVASTASSDLLVLRKSSTRTVEQPDAEPMTVMQQSLDQHEGTIHGVTDEVVQFEVEGQMVNVRREKLEGLVFYSRPGPPPPPAVCRLIDTAGSVWLLREAQWEGGQFLGRTVGDVALTLPERAVSRLDFSAGNVVWLSDLEPEGGLPGVAVSLQPARMAFPFSRLFAVRTRPPGAESFFLAGQRYERGLWLHSPLKLVYRVPEGFHWFRALAGIDDSVLAPGQFDLVLLGDGRELFRQPLGGDLSRQPLPIALDVRGLGRLTIVLEPAAGQDLGDQLDLVEARFTK